MSGSPVLIAELCQNHQGNRDVLRDMVQAAADAGADYAKIQALYSADLTHRDRFERPLIDATGKPLTLLRPRDAELARLSQLDLTPDDEALFVEICAEAGIKPLVTVFTRTTVSRLAGLGFPAVKIASYDCASYPLLRDVAANWPEIILSTGGMFRSEIIRAVGELTGTALTLLHCVTLYPTPLDQVNLARIEWLKGLAPRAGLSDHTLVTRDGLWASKAALALGADTIERHFTILPAERTKDGPVSITPDDLAELRRFGALSIDDRRAELAQDRPDWTSWIGVPDAEPGREEMMNRDYYAGRVASWVNGRPIFNWEDVALEVYQSYSNIAEAITSADGARPAKPDGPVQLRQGYLMPGYEMLGDEELDLIREVFARGAVLLRHGFDARRRGLYMVRDFESEFARRVGAPYSLATASATAGIKIALRALGVRPGDEVITQAFTFIATVEGIIEAGARPVIAEVDATLNMDPERLEEAITSRTKAIIPVHMLGVPADMPRIMRVADNAGVPVIEDAAQALGAKVDGREVGTWGLCGVHSFDYNKTITVGEGGMLVSSDGDFVERALRYHDHGHVNDPTLPRGEDAWDGLGFNYRMSEVTAAIGLAQLRKLDHIIAANHRNFRYLSERLVDTVPADIRPVPERSEPLNDCLTLQFETPSQVAPVTAAMAAAGVAAKNVPNALRWHFARYWSHILSPFGMGDVALDKLTAQSRYYLDRSVAIPIQVRQSEAVLDEIAKAVQDACAVEVS